MRHSDDGLGTWGLGGSELNGGGFGASGLVP